MKLILTLFYILLILVFYNGFSQDINSYKGGKSYQKRASRSLNGLAFINEYTVNNNDTIYDGLHILRKDSMNLTFEFDGKKGYKFSLKQENGSSDFSLNVNYKKERIECHFSVYTMHSYDYYYKNKLIKSFTFMPLTRRRFWW
jgi:hypothetical protein